MHFLYRRSVVAATPVSQPACLGSSCSCKFPASWTISSLFFLWRFFCFLRLCLQTPSWFTCRPSPATVTSVVSSVRLHPRRVRSPRFQQLCLCLGGGLPHRCLVGSSNLIFLEPKFSPPQAPPSKLPPSPFFFLVLLSVTQTNLKSSLVFTYLLTYLFVSQPVVLPASCLSAVLWGQALIRWYSSSHFSLLTCSSPNSPCRILRPLTAPYCFSRHLPPPDR